jgi:ferredoxin
MEGGRRMTTIRKTAEELIKSGAVNIIIGYGEGSNGRVRPVFARDEKEIEQLIFDQRCTGNLAGYLSKKEISKFGKPGIFANIRTLRAIIRLVAEKQINEGDLIAIYTDETGKTTVYTALDEIEAYLATITPQINEEDKELLDKLNNMSASERWSFWQKEMENCIKCYACRQACPLCYCTQCTTEINKPQWIPVGASKAGNLEWHIMRAMHLAGRCVSCGQCGDACPTGIPIHLLPIKLSDDIKNVYGNISGMSRNENCAMSTYQPDDKETFIG